MPVVGGAAAAVSPSVGFGADLTLCLRTPVAQVIRNRIRALATAMGWCAISAFIASRAWDFAERVVVTPFHTAFGAAVVFDPGSADEFAVSGFDPFAFLSALPLRDSSPFASPLFAAVGLPVAFPLWLLN